jgi:hypothetical protein
MPDDLNALRHAGNTDGTAMVTRILPGLTAALVLLLVVVLDPTWLQAGSIENDPTVSFSCSSVTEIPMSECSALVALYSNTDGPTWKDKSGWLATGTPCSWYGVNCSSGHVTQLTLATNGLFGYMPSELGNLVYLRYLNLNANHLVGNIPPELGRLSKLTSLNLCLNQLTGPIPPELGNLTSLNDELMLYYNHLSGPIPKELGRLTRLRHFHAYDNELSGEIPPELGSMSSLVSLWLSSNRISGGVPGSLGNLSSLEDLLIDDNSLSGALPASLTSRPLQTFWFNNTQLCEPGDLPFQNWLAGIPDLRRTGSVCTSLSINFITGAPGSYFLITGCGFPANADASVTVNGHLLGTVRTDDTGCLSLILLTSGADPGRYDVTVTVNPSASTSFLLGPEYPVRPQQGTEPSLIVPPDIALDHNVYVPISQR